MTANDQAYDSHAGNGYLSNNDIGFWCKESGGTNRVLAHVDTNDIGQFGDTSLVENAMNTRAKAYAQLSGSQSVPTGVATLVELDTEIYDIGGDFDVGSYKFVTPVAGYYLIIGCVRVDDIDDGDSLRAEIYVDGAVVARGEARCPGANLIMHTNVQTVYYVAATKDIELYAYQNEGNNQDVIAGLNTFMSVHLLSIGN